MNGYVQRLCMTLACAVCWVGLSDSLGNGGIAVGWVCGVIFAVVVLGGPDLINRYCVEIEKWWESRWKS